MIDFREYLIGSVCLARLASKKEVADNALKVSCDIIMYCLIICITTV